MKKNTKKTLIAIGILVVIIAAFNAKPLYEKELTYQKCLDYLENDHPVMAEVYFNEIPSYRHSDTLALYARALYMSRVNYYTKDEILENLNQIPDSYSGPYADDIEELKLYVLTDFEKDVAERKKEEAIKKIEFLTELANKLPYKNMSESYIDNTIVGKHTKKDSERVMVSQGKWDTMTKYFWSRANGDTYLRVDCIDGRVTEVTKINEAWYWNSDGTPDFDAPDRTYNSASYGYSSGHSSSHSSNHSSVNKKNEYDVYDYDDPEDFYYENADSFDSYEDAEDYYDEAWDD